MLLKVYMKKKLKNKTNTFKN